MKKHLLFFATLMAMAFVACDKNNLIEQNMLPAQKGEQITVTAYTPEQDESQTRITNNYDNDGWGISWEMGDTFSVMRGGENQTFTKATGTNLFSGVLPQAGSGNYYATFPATEATDITAVPYDFSEPLLATRYLMYSSSESGTEYQFKHAPAYLKITVNGYEGAMTKLIITTPEGTSAKGTIDLTTGKLTAGEKKSITQNFSEINYVEAGHTINGIPIPPLAADNKQITVSVLSDNGKSYTATIAGEEGKAIEAGKYYTVTANVTEQMCYLPAGNIFRDEIADFVTAEYNGLIFYTNSSTTSENEIQGTTGEKAYIVQNTNKIQLEIHTKASKFVFNEDCSEMFSVYENSKLQYLTFINFNNCCDTSNVKDMSYMFDSKINGTGYGRLRSINFQGFDTSNVENMSNMFFYFGNGWTTVTSLDVSAFDTSNVTNMRSMFSNCYYLETITFGENFNTSKVEYMNEMFYNCSRLTSIDLSHFSLGNATCYDMFKGVGSSLPTDAKTQIKVTELTKTHLENKITGINTGDGRAEYVVVD